MFNKNLEFLEAFSRNKLYSTKLKDSLRHEKAEI